MVLLDRLSQTLSLLPLNDAGIGQALNRSHPDQTPRRLVAGHPTQIRHH
ncbi:Uncharacterised protein [Vibrio cholerae]|nr:Uncharacterised protein [Vibrio cholerae]